MKSQLGPVIHHGDKTYRSMLDTLHATSVREMPEPRSMQGVAAVATGSLPAFVGELLHQIRARETEAAKNRARFDGTGSCSWDAYMSEEHAWQAAAMLVEILAATRGVQIQRQPEENK